MNITINRPIDFDAKYLLAKLGVRFWCDCRLSKDNGNTWQKFEDSAEGNDLAMSKVPCVTTDNIGYGSNYYWTLKIDLDEGKVVDWPAGICIESGFKVCDDGKYFILDKDDNIITDLTEEFEQFYVPDFLSLEDNGYGDYAYINIDGAGKINKAELMKQRIVKFFEDKINV